MSTQQKTSIPRRSIVVVEDDAFLRSLLANVLEEAGFDVQTAATCADARRAFRLLDPDAMIIDIDLGEGPDGYDLASSVRKASPEIAIVFLTAQPDPRFAGKSEAVIAKNSVYLNKNLLTDTRSLTDAVDAALLERNTDRYRHDLRRDRPLANLSNTQIQVLKLIASGKTNQQIAQERSRSLAATESAIARTLEAMGIPKDAELNARVAAAVKFVSETKS